MSGILDGLRVIEGSAFVAAPSAGMTLAQMGAEVIRFDPIAGGLDYRRWPVTDDGESIYWASLNKAKKSIAIDIRNPEGREIATALITAPGPDAGLFLTNFPASGWLAYDALQARREDLIMVNVQGNPDGSSALDYTINCAVGFPFVTGPKGHDGPVNHVLPAWDVATGLQAVTGMLAAERHRHRHGEGQFVSISLSDVAFATAANLGYVGDAQINRVARERGGNDLYGAFGREFATSDGRWVMISAITNRQWRTLVETVGMQDAIAALGARRGLDCTLEGDRFEAHDEIAALIEPWCAGLTFEAAGAALEAGGVLWGPYRTFDQALAEDWRLSTKNPLFEDVDQPGIGRYLMPGTPLDFSASPRLPAQAAPRLGQHTDEVLADVLGLAGAEIGRLHDDGVVAGAGEM